MAVVITNTQDVEDKIRDIIAYLGDDPTREGLIETPKRVVNAWRELFSGYNQDPKKVCKTFESPIDEMIILKDIEFFSTCEHHMIPFYGRVHIGYIPNGRIIGVSKLARIVEIYSRRLQIQERMTKQIAEAIIECLEPKGIGVIVEGVHLCMRARGVAKQNSVMVTSVMLGCFKENESCRQEFLSMVGYGKSV